MLREAKRASTRKRGRDPVEKRPACLKEEKKSKILSEKKSRRLTNKKKGGNCPNWHREGKGTILNCEREGESSTQSTSEESGIARFRLGKDGEIAIQRGKRETIWGKKNCYPD